MTDKLDEIVCAFCGDCKKLGEGIADPMCYYYVEVKQQILAWAKENVVVDIKGIKYLLDNIKDWKRNDNSELAQAIATANPIKIKEAKNGD